MGEHYVELKDYAIELNKKYNLGIDVDLIAACQDAHDEKDEKYRMAKLDIILKELESNGYKDAAEFLQGKIL